MSREMQEALRLLIVEDDEDDAELVCLELERAGFELTWARVDTEGELRRALLTSEWDLIISDFAMPEFDGLRAFAVFCEMRLDIPFIFVSGALGEDRAVQAMRAGARDYLLKGNLTRLSEAVRREISEARTRLMHRQTEVLAKRQQRRLSMALEASGAAVFEHDIPLGEDMFFSAELAELLGYGVQDVPRGAGALDWVLDRIHQEDVHFIRPDYEDLLRGSRSRCSAEIRIRHKDRGWVDVAVFAKATERTPDGSATQVVGVVLDRTEHTKLQAQFRQAQKMEAVGRLAGGVAHDFNNLLTVIMSLGAFVAEDLRPQDPVRKDLEEILKAAERAEELTRQLLAFSRKQVIDPRVVNMNTVVNAIDRMLRRILGEDIEYLTSLASDLWNTRLDPGAFEQVIVNLAINARDAMPNGGELTIETQNVHLDAAYGRSHNVEPGEYVALIVSDSGEGMDEETRSKIFEPFFTTKDADRGTGLGLATCYGIVKQAGGHIWVDSKPSHGTTFKIHLPRVAAREDVVAPEDPTADLQGRERILVVEDDPQVRALCERSLRKFGYDVVAVETGGDALIACEDESTAIDLLITDVVMPRMSGRDLAKRLLQQRPNLRVLYMSGYTADAILPHGVVDEGLDLLQKPFRPKDLATAVQRVFARPAPGGRRRPRILLIDDDARILRSTSRVLKRDYDVTLANSGEAALALIRTEDFDLVLSDVIMPEMTGADVFAQVKQDRPEVADRFVFVTGHQDKTFIDTLLASADRPVVNKPLEAGQVERLVADATDG